MSDGQPSRSKSITSGDVRKVFAWKLIEYIGLAAYVIYLPRVMGLTQFGELAVIISVTSILWVASSLGAQSVFGRFFPELLEQGEIKQVRVLFSQILITRTLLIGLLAFLYPYLLRYFLPDTGLYELWLATAVFVLGAICAVFFQLQFGLNHLSRWVVRESSKKLILIVGLILIGLQPTLELVLKLMLIIETAYFLVGLYWSRMHFYFGADLFDMKTLASSLRFGLTFFFSNLLLLSVWRSGELLLAKLAPGDALEAVAHFSVANAIAFTVYSLFTQLSMLLVPSMTAFYVRGEMEKNARWMANLLKYGAIAIIMAMIVVYAVGDELVFLVFGEDYVRTAWLLFILLIALVPMSVIRIAMSLAMVKKTLRKIFALTLPAFMGFLLAGIVMTQLFGASGTAAALIVAALIGAAIAINIFDLKGVIVASKVGWVLVVGVLSLVIQYLGMLGDIYNLILSTGVFLGGLLLFNVVKLQEVRVIMRLK